jgi:hypothetical protein
MKHYSFEAMTPWKSLDGKEEKIIIWYRHGRLDYASARI